HSRSLAGSLGVACAAGVLSFSAWAGESTSVLAVTASVAQNCLISANAVAFGSYDPVVTNSASGAALNGTGSVSVTCTRSSTGVTITLGLGSHATGSTRRMVGGGSGAFLAYELYQPSATTPAATCSFPGTTIWNATGGGIFTPTGVADWGAASPKTFNVCGTVPRGQDAAADSYTDSVIATINF
ncbi:MAG: Csu type fimbrial protein, partial [Burkholderiales bacterium]